MAGALLGHLLLLASLGAAAFFVALVFLSLQGCSHLPKSDPSPDAVASRDLTLASSACQAAPGQGMDLCRLTEGAAVAGSWVLIIPRGDTTGQGTLSVYFRDGVRSYAVPKGAASFEIPWKDFFLGEPKWKPEMGGVAMALLAMPYRDAEGIDRVAKFRGMAYLEVLKPGYVPLPIGSELGTWATDCRITYSTSGRSAVSCR
jgi:hypothetical protein